MDRITPSQVNKRKKRCWKKADWEQLGEILRDKILQEDWNKELNENLDNSANLLSSIMKENIEKTVPEFEIKPYRNKWWNQNLHEMRKNWRREKDFHLKSEKRKEYEKAILDAMENIFQRK